MRSTTCTDNVLRRQPARGGYLNLNGAAKTPARGGAPWLLVSYMQGEVDLNHALAARFPNMPHMSIFREGAGQGRFAFATLATQDGAAALHLELDTATGALECRFILASMLSLRFHVGGLSKLDRRYWLDVMRAGDGDPAFLWSEERWNTDYLICSAHRYYTHLFAFSPLQLEAAARLTPEVTRRLLDWLEGCWFPAAVEARNEAPASAFVW